MRAVRSAAKKSEYMATAVKCVRPQSVIRVDLGAKPDKQLKFRVKKEEVDADPPALLAENALNSAGSSGSDCSSLAKPTTAIR